MRPLALACLLALAAWAPGARADDAPSPDDVRPLEAAGRFDEAAAVLEQRATVPGVAPDVAHAWLDRALDYRIALDDTEAATRVLRALAAVAPVAHVAARELNLGEVLIRAQRWRESAAFHAAWLTRHGQRADATLRARANVALGNAMRELGDEVRALAAYREVRVVPVPPPPPPPPFLGGGAASGPSPRRSPYPMADDPNAPQQRDVPLAALRAEAMFWQTEPRYRRFVARTIPVYSGPPDRRGYDHWVQIVLNSWVVAMVSELYGPLSYAYSAVIREHDPAWEIAAFERIAAAIVRFVDLLRLSPPPPDIHRSRELVCGYQWEPPWLPLLETANEGFRRCIRLSTHYRSTHSLSRCERALYDLDHTRFPLADELTPALTHRALAALDLPLATR